MSITDDEKQEYTTNKKMKLADFDKYNASPFDAKIKKRNKQVVSKQVGEAYSSVTGELLSNNVSLVVHKPMDRSEFIKLFTSNLSMFFKINESEFKVFIYMLQNLEINTGRARFNIHDCIKDTGYSKVTTYRAIAGLCQNEFVARTLMPYYYWINPSIVFNGNRMSIQSK